MTATCDEQPRIGLRLPLRAIQLLGLALLVAAFASLASATVETEPNDDPGQANDLVPGDPASGYAPSGDADFWRVNVSMPAILEVHLLSSSECWTLRIAWANNTTAQVGLTNGPDGGQLYRLAVSVPQDVLIQACGYYSGNYAFFANLSTDFSAFSGFDEVELNNERATATPIPADHYAEGIVHGGWNDVDFWRFDSNVSGWLRVRAQSLFSTGLQVSGWNESGEVAATPIYDNFYSVVYPVSAGEAFHLRFFESYTLGPEGYLFRVKFVERLSELAPRGDEVEPNDDVANASVLTPGVDFNAFVDPVLDPTDSFRIDAVKGDLIHILVQAPDRYPYGAISVGAVLGPERFPSPGTPWYSTTYAWSDVFLEEDAAIVLSVTSPGYPGTSFIVNVTRTHFEVLDDGVLALPELINVLGAGYSGYDLAPRWNSYLSGSATYNLTNGDLWLFGQSACLVVYGISNDLHGVLVERGQVFSEPDGSRYARFVSTQTASLNLTPNMGSYDVNPTCFNAMTFPWSPSFQGSYGGYRYVGAGLLDGDAALVLREIGNRSADNAAGTLALWAATGAVNESRARESGADDAVLREAIAILEAAGVTTCLNGLATPECKGVYPPSPEPPNECGNLAVTRVWPEANNTTAPTPPGQNNTSSPTPSTNTTSTTSDGLAPRAIEGAAAGAAVGGGVGVAALVGLAVATGGRLGWAPLRRTKK